MIINLHGFFIELTSAHEEVNRQWELLFDYELKSIHLDEEDTEPNIKLEVNITNALPTCPKYISCYKVPGYQFSVYNIGDGQHIIEQHGFSQGEINLNYSPNIGSKDPDTIHISLTPEGLASGVLEDVTMNLLAPIARRHGLFIIHGTSVVNHLGTAILFVAPTQHGKTTSGLSMIASGWQFLANDASFMIELNDGIHSLISPGSINVRPGSFALLPNLRDQTAKTKHTQILNSTMIPRTQLINLESHKKKGKVARIFFPEVRDQKDHIIQDVPRSIGLARLMEQSMDQWDHDVWQPHLDFLERLSTQVQFRSIKLGTDLDSLPGIIEQDLSME